MLLAFVKSLFSRKADAPSEAAPARRAVAYEELSDEDLMFAYAEGDVDAFSVLLKRHERPLYNFILRSCRNPDVADELVQEVFLRVVKSGSSYQKTAKFTTWLYTLARNICIDRARKTSRRVEVSLDQKIGGEDDGRTLLDGLADLNAQAANIDHDRKEFRALLAKALEELPEEQREVFLMREVSGLKFQEISEVLGVPLPTVKSRMRYALEFLRGAMASYRDHSFDEEEKVEVLP
jgi:RNA polymerase sigma-70 factor, ECF subfamily